MTCSGRRVRRCRMCEPGSGHEYECCMLQIPAILPIQHAGGALIYIRENYSKRLKIISIVAAASP